MLLLPTCITGALSDTPRWKKQAEERAKKVGGTHASMCDHVAWSGLSYLWLLLLLLLLQVKELRATMKELRQQNESLAEVSNPSCQTAKLPHPAPMLTPVHCQSTTLLRSLSLSLSGGW